MKTVSHLMRIFTLTLVSGHGYAVPFSEYILAPSDRTIYPSAVYEIQGNVQRTEQLCLFSKETQASTTFTGVNSTVTLDFGKNIAGTVQFNVESLSGDDEFLGFSFTESSMWISPFHCDSGTNATFDDPLWFKVTGPGQYAAEKKHQRGGFRYMSIWYNSTGTISIRGVSVNFTASPELGNPQQYQGFFNSDSEKLNRVWYAGAYTNQLCSVDPAYGNALGVPGTNWYYNASIATSPDGTSVLIDGAKRDRLVWPGDIAISAPSTFVSTGSLDGIKNGIESLFLLQQPDGRLPWAGTPFTSPTNFIFSFTYHLYTLLDVYYYHLYTGDDEFLQALWPQYKKGISWSLGTIDGSGMANVSSSDDWLRFGMGGHNVEANSILYHVLDVSQDLAAALGDGSMTEQFRAAMETIQQSVNGGLWDPSHNLFFDNDTTKALWPQDGNSWAIISGIADKNRADAISTALKSRWIRPYGAPAPEAGPTISPFVSGFEVQAHYLAGHPERAVDLMEFMWADFMLDDSRMTNSSFIEGYSTNGSIHYPPYDNDARISHAHGWATGPTSSLTFFGAGIRLMSTIGRTWQVQPRLGGLQRVTAGFMTPLGRFEASWTCSDGIATAGYFETPPGSSGTLILQSATTAPVVEGPKGHVSANSTGDGTYVFENLPGGKYTVSP